MPRPLDRRQFIHGSLAATAAVATWRPTFGMRRLEKLRVAAVGVGGMGSNDLASVASHPEVEIAGVCDIDLLRLAAAGEKHPAAKRFVDWREMFAELGDACDAVIVSTPDHMHAPVSMTALVSGKHVYCQKPLTHSVNEGRAISLAAKARPSLATQMGTQVASAQHKRQAAEHLRRGIVGTVRSIHGWSDRPVNYWRQGRPRPSGSNPIPNEVAWYNWLGVAPDRPYLKGVYHPFAWRGFRDFGCGALGDMACHIVDTPLQAMDLLVPTQVAVECSDSTDDMFPSREIVRFMLKGNRYTGGNDIPFVWSDGGIVPAAADLGLPEGFQVPQNTVAIVGEGGTLLVPYDTRNTQLFVGGAAADLPALPIDGRNHYHHWVECCFGRDRTQTDFAYAGTLCEMLSLGALASMFPGETLLWDAAAMRIPNSDFANSMVTRVYRDGWQVPMPTRG